MAATFEREAGRFRPYMTFGSSHFRNRATGNRLDDFKLAGGLSTNYRRGSTAVEYCVQANAGRQSGAFLAEGSFKRANGRLSYAAWWYGTEFIDLASGGRGSDLRTQISLPAIDFTLRSKRPGQRGAQMKGTLGIGDNTRLLGAIVVARRSADSSNFQWLGGIERGLTDRWSLRVDYLQSDRERDDADGENDRFAHRVRTEARFTTDRVKARSYLAFSSTSSYGDYVSLFTGARMKLNETMRGEIWSNLSRVAKSRIDYWYLYAKLSQQLMSGISFSAKLNHRYDRRAAVRHANAVTLELEALW